MTDAPAHESQTLSLYVHVPFCTSRCSYCDFFSTVYESESTDKYLDAVSRELDVKSANRLFGTVYIGGGTPSCLEPKQLAVLLSTIIDSVKLAEDAEFTMEVNPDTVDRRRLSVAIEYGVNRISMGIQTFHARLLSLLSRRHTAEQAQRAVKLVRKMGIANLSLDLIFGIPGESIADWEADLSSAAACAPEHVSTYCLGFEENTLLKRMVCEGKLAPLSQDTLRQMMKTANSRLCAEGYERYEISNYARPGFSCKHNIKYWQNAEYVGVGPSAVTFVAGVRSQNVSDLPKYFSILDWRAAPHEYEERLDAEKRARETLFLGLRMREGVDLTGFRLKTGCDVLELCGEEIARFSGLGLVEFSDGRIRLTDEGVYVADSVFAELV